MMALSQDQIGNLDKLIISSFYKLSQTRTRISPAEITEYLCERFGDVWNVSRLTALAEKTLDKSVELGLISKRSGVAVKCPRCRLPFKRSRAPPRRHRFKRTLAKRSRRRKR